MKKIYPAVLSLFAVFSVNAQLTQANHAPVHNDMYATYQCDTVSPGASGNGVVWNYSSIATHSSIVKSYTAQTVSTPNYPNATIAVASSPQNTFYYNATSSALSYYGGNIAVGPVVGTLNYTAPAVYAAYPMSINTTSTAIVGGSLNVTAPLTASGTFTGTSSVLADATGTLMLPGGTPFTYTNVLRVVTSQTIDFNAGFASGTVWQMNYDYYSPGFKEPVFTITTSTVTALASTSTQTFVTRNKNGAVTTVGINETKSSIANVFVYPNPSSAFVNFVTDSKEATQVLIYDVTGKLVESQNFNEGKIKLDVSSYNKGLYFYTVTGNNNQKLKSGKITVSQ